MIFFFSNNQPLEEKLIKESKYFTFHNQTNKPTLFLDCDVFSTLRISLPVYMTTPMTVPGKKQQIG